MRWRLIVIGAVVAVLTAITPVTHAAEPTVEDRVISLINAARSPDLVVHWGLLSAARGHSQEMARDGAIGHEGADERVNSAPPDPGEFNGAPDDGFGVAAWCENVTYTIVAGAEEAAERIFDQWQGGAHERCMMDTSRNVGAVGVYWDGQSWWATFIAEKDATPPGAAPTSKPKPAAPAESREPPEPVATVRPATDDAPASGQPRVDAMPAGVVMVEATPQPAPTASPEPSVDEPVPQSVNDRRSSAEEQPAPSDVPVIAEDAAVPIEPRPGVGWPELAAVAAVLALATALLRRTLRRRPPSVDDPVVVELPDLVGIR